MTVLDLDAIEARWTATFREFGPWQFLDRRSWGDKSSVADGAGHPLAFVGEGEQAKADGTFMASAHEDVPALVAEVRRLRMALTEAQKR